MARYDALLDDTFDLVSEGDEWLSGESDDQNILIMCYVDKGEIREFPFAGFGAYRRIKSREDKRKFNRDLRIELENDGYNRARIILGTNNIQDFKIEINEADTPT